MITNAALVMVHLTGIEPALLSEIEPKSIVSANFTTGAILNFVDFSQRIDCFIIPMTYRKRNLVRMPISPYPHIKFLLILNNRAVAL